MSKKKVTIVRRRVAELSPYERNAVPLEQIEAELRQAIEAFVTEAVPRYLAERASVDRVDTKPRDMPEADPLKN